MDLAAIFTGIVALVTGIGGIVVAIREVRRRERRAATANMRAYEHDLNQCQAENVKLHQYTYVLRTRLADEGHDVPDPP